MNKTLIALALAASLQIGLAEAQAADITALTAKADRGDLKAMYEAGSHYLANGEAARGMLYLEHVIRTGDANSAYAHAAIARHYETMGDTPIARDAKMYHYRQAAVLGEVSSQIRLGTILLDLAAKSGNDLSLKSQHQTQAQVLLEHASNAGNSFEAAYQLGKAYLSGHGVDRDAAKGETWLARAADGKHVAAAYMLGEHGRNKGDATLALRYLEAAAELGHGKAMLDLATAYESGGLIGEDLDKAKRWATKAATANVAGATDLKNRIGAKERSRQEAIAAAARRNAAPVAQMGNYRQPAYRQVATNRGAQADQVAVLRQQLQQVTQMLNQLTGEEVGATQEFDLPVAMPGVDEDLNPNQRGLDAYARGRYEEAYRHFTRASRKGDADAMNNLGLMLLQGKGVASDPVKAMAQFRASAEQGHVTAAANIAYMYRYGAGVRQDLARATVWQQHSAALSQRAQRMSGYAGL